MENGRGRKRLGSAARFSLAGCRYHPPPLPLRQEEKLERKKETLMLFPLLYSFSHFSFRLPFRLCRRGTLFRYTLLVLSTPFSSFLFKIFHLRVTPSFHLHPSRIFDLGVPFFPSFPSIPVALFVFLLLEAFYPLFTLLVLFFYSLFLFTTSHSIFILILSPYFNFSHFNSYLSLLEQSFTNIFMII